MSTFITEMHSHAFDFDRVAPSAQTEIRLAQQAAARMKAPEVYPEHLFLGVLALAVWDLLATKRATAAPTASRSGSERVSDVSSNTSPRAKAAPRAKAKSNGKARRPKARPTA